MELLHSHGVRDGCAGDGRRVPQQPLLQGGLGKSREDRRSGRQAARNARRKALANAVARAPAEHDATSSGCRPAAPGAIAGCGRHPRGPSRFLLPTLEETHASLVEFPAFEPIDAGEPVQPPRIEASAREMLCSDAVTSHVARLTAHVKEMWRGYRAAFLAPCLSFYRPDDLVLLFDVDPHSRRP